MYVVSEFKGHSYVHYVISKSGVTLGVSMGKLGLPDIRNTLRTVADNGDRHKGINSHFLHPPGNTRFSRINIARSSAAVTVAKQVMHRQAVVAETQRKIKFFDHIAAAHAYQVLF